MGKNRFKYVLRAISIIIVFIFIILSIQLFDASLLIDIAYKLFKQPLWLLIMIIGYAFAFVIRAWAWWLYLGGKVPFLRCLDGIWYSLFVNHLLPFKVGEAVRMKVALDSKKVTWDEAAGSVIILRLLDLSILLLISGIGTFVFIGTLHIRASFYYLIILSAFLLLLLKVKFPSFIKKQLSLVLNVFMHRRGSWIVLAVLISWICEAIVIIGTVTYFNYGIPFFEAVWVNSVTVGSSIFQIAPGGIATYESVMSFTLASIQIPVSDAYHIAIVSHVFKFAFSYVVGIYVMIKSPIHFSLKDFKRKGGSMI